MLINAIGHDVVTPAITLLWTNSNPTSAFAASTVSLDRDGYDFLLIECLTSTTELYRTASLVLNDTGVGNQYISCLGGNTSASRMATIKDGGITFTTGYYVNQTDSYTLASGSGTGYAIPYRIYGYNP